jgi:hypothetical protein
MIDPELFKRRNDFRQRGSINVSLVIRNMRARLIQLKRKLRKYMEKNMKFILIGLFACLYAGAILFALVHRSNGKASKDRPPLYIPLGHPTMWSKDLPLSFDEQVSRCKQIQGDMR